MGHVRSCCGDQQICSETAAFDMRSGCKSTLLLNFSSISSSSFVLQHNVMRVSAVAEVLEAANRRNGAQVLRDMVRCSAFFICYNS